ncbi:cobalt ECF transporter T component CbiQ [Limnoglobus roseus]|uniref:Cobalt transport protein CbiQ n=1 Tax=Limnoglobus roseus TaxID=2598579 RepID=A0A5C1AHD9_9BACT|nr:cobalt ECF transporter T component CbiQ [Limnoglobus roseus]QEL18240.1 Cobalt transport protein CbiQ [Limnoglobus roseus]
MNAREIYDPDNRWRLRHPAEKAVFAGGMLLLSVAAPSGVVLGVVLATVTATTLLLAAVSWRKFAGGMAAPFGFLLVGAIPVLVASGVNPDTQEAEWRLDVAAAGHLVLRGLTATACLVSFATTTSLPEFLGLLRAIRCPEVLTEWMLLTYRFSQSLLLTVASAHLAQQLRLGLGSPRARVRAAGLLGANLLPRSFEKAKRLERGLECRGYDGQLRTLSPRRRVSWPVLGLVVAVQILLAAWAVAAGRGNL